MSETKRCGRCGETRQREEFGRDRSRPDGLFSYCKPCKKATGAADYLKHREERNEKSKAVYAANPEPVKARMRAKYRADPAAWKADVIAWQAANPEKKKRYGATWTKRNLAGAVRENVRRRYARRKGATTIVFSKAQLEQRMAYWGNRCWVCGGPRQAVDHVKPLAKGGAHMLCNLRPICTRCNASKNDTWPFAI